MRSRETRMRSAFGRILIVALAILLALLATACGNLNTPNWDNLPAGTYAPHPVFEEFYLENGSIELFGYPISTIYTDQNGKRYQFFETVLMSFDPAREWITFEPLGLELNLDTLPVLVWNGEGRDGDDGLIVGEFRIHPAFVPLYLSFGPDRVGLPISHPFYNPGRNRMEQHFEGAGMFYLLDDPEQTPALLNYGLVSCSSCRPQNNPRQNNAGIAIPLTNSSFYDQMRWANIPISVTGEPIKGPAEKAGGATELVFENMVLVIRDGALKIKKVPVLLGLKEESLYTPIAHPELIFFPIKGDGGHNIYRPFDEYIQENGGYAVSGAPISEIVPINRELNQVRQCFENYCLEYNPLYPEAVVRPIPLGQLYLEQVSPVYVGDKENSETPPENLNTRHLSPFTMIVWEHPTVVDSQTPETISVKVVLEETPQPGLTVQLKVTLPDGAETTYEMPPTAEDGTTSYTLSPIQAENSQLVFYEACLQVQGETQVCVAESFMIWGNP